MSPAALWGRDVGGAVLRCVLSHWALCGGSGTGPWSGGLPPTMAGLPAAGLPHCGAEVGECGSLVDTHGGWFFVQRLPSLIVTARLECTRGGLWSKVCSCRVH
jgi:hypothetical protein